MNIIKASYEIVDDLNPAEIYAKLERSGRVCYKSEDKICEGSGEKFIENIIKRGHESVIEHVSFSVKFIIDRGVSHELVRHRLASFSQESTRYVNYKDGNMTFIEPLFLEGNQEAKTIWLKAMEDAENHYNQLITLGWRAEEARSVLPNSVKTEVFVTANLREWRHILRLRGHRSAHPQIREVMLPLATELAEKLPAIFKNIIE